MKGEEVEEDGAVDESPSNEADSNPGPEPCSTAGVTGVMAAEASSGALEGGVSTCIALSRGSFGVGRPESGGAPTAGFEAGGDGGVEVEDELGRGAGTEIGAAGGGGEGAP